MTPNASKELKRCVWVFIGSFFFTPLLLWFFVAFVLGREHSFQKDMVELYRDLFSLRLDMIFAWVILFVPVLIFQFVLACHHYYRHPEQLRTIFQFPPRGRR